MIKRNNNGFTLIELLAVIIIISLLMMIAIPSINKLIGKYRKNVYVDTAKQYISSLRTMLLAREYDMWDTNTTYYVPISCIPLESGGDSPYGKFAEAYVAVWYHNDSHSFYWISRDTAGMGIPTLTRYNDLTINTVTPEVSSIKNDVSVGNTTVIKMLGASCDVNQATTIVPETNPKSFSEDD